MRQLERRWTETFWREVAPKRGIAAPDSLRRVGDPESEVALLAARLEELEELEQQATKIVVEWRSPPPLTERRVLHEPWLLTRSDRRSYERRLEYLCEWLEKEADGLPVGVEGRMRMNSSGPDLDVHLLSSVPRGAAPLVVRHGGLLDDLRALFGSKRRIQLGIESFDGLFVIEGDEATARTLLDGSMRNTLLRLGELTPVELRMGDGRARIGRYPSLTVNPIPTLVWFRKALAIARVLHQGTGQVAAHVVFRSWAAPAPERAVSASPADRRPHIRRRL